MEENEILDNAQYEYKGNISAGFIQKALNAFEKYKADKKELCDRVKANNEWYRAQYGKLLNRKTNETEPATAFIFSAIENKYADAIDNFPTANFLEREPSDTDTAQLLSKIIPLQLDMSGYKKCYKVNWRKKLKGGTGVYGAFYDEKKDDIDIRYISFMNVYCDMNVSDVQESQFLFITAAIDNDSLREEYPQYKPLFDGDTRVESYNGTNEIKDRTEVIDCYYKKTDGTLHMIKFVGSTVIDATEDKEGYENGLYEHGMYPVVFDVLYPEEDCPFGFGVVDVIRNPQQYIDKLDGIIIKNALMSGKKRWFIKEGSGIDEKAFMNMENDIVKTSQNVSEDNIREISVSSLPTQVMTHRTTKINELKEVVGNRDFQQGGTSGGVNAASAITALQQAGEKLSRAIIDDGYDAYKSLVIMVIGLMRQFYTEERIYRITNEAGEKHFMPFSGDMLVSSEIETDSLGFMKGVKYKNVEFDIDVIPQRQNPFSKEINNQTIMSLWTTGFFAPQNFEYSMVAMQAMNFDGKEKIIEQLRQLHEKQMEEQMRAAQTQQIQQMQTAQMTQGGGEDLVPVGQVNRTSQIESNDELVPVGQIGG